MSATRFLLRVRTVAEAAQAAQAGVEAVAFAPPRDEARVATAAIRSAFPRTLRLVHDNAADCADAAKLAADAGADEIAVPAEALLDADACAGKVATVATIAGAAISRDMLGRLRARAQAVMIEFGRGTSPFAQTDIATLDLVATACRANGLGLGIGGDIEDPDIARLLLLEPDLLGFDDTVRVGHRAEGSLDAAALESARALVARSWRSPAPQVGRSVDRLFVRDFVIDLSIGAYRAERVARQRVRFDVEVEVARDPRPPRDMRDVFSYDIIIETIRVLARRDHVAFVETLAEEVAAKVLTHEAALSATVRVSKLDVIAGAVGIEIRRDRRG